MLKTRVIPVLTIKDSKLVKSVQFTEHRNIGNYIAAVRVFNAREVDEMIFIDLDAYKTGLNIDLLKKITKECFMPLAIGGGIKTLDDIRSLLKIGADKVVINTAATKDRDFIKKASEMFGRQCIVVSIDARKIGGKYKVFSQNGKVETGVSPDEWAAIVERQGAGEIFITSIDRDGMMNGYDVDLAKMVSSVVKIPVIVSGGAGNLEDFKNVIKNGNVSAVAAASIFQYTQITPNNIKQYLKDSGIETRI